MRPGEVNISVSHGRGSVVIDGFDLTQHITAVKLMFDAKRQRPVLLLDLLPTTVNVTADSVDLDGPFREFLIRHGWQPPR